MTNLPELAVAYWACLRIGAIAAPLNIRLKTAELREILERLRPSLYLGGTGLFPAVVEIEPEILAADARFVAGGAVPGGGARSWASLLEGADAAPARNPIARDAPALLFLTTGTTGQPKLAVHTPATLAAIAASFEHLALSGSEIVLNGMPMTHGAGATLFLSCVHFGAPMILLERFDPSIALDAIAAYGCSWMLGLPFMFAELLQRQQRRPHVIGSLRHCFSVGDVCPPDLEQQFKLVFGGVPLRSVLASSEIAFSLAAGARSGPVSRVPPGTEVSIVNEAGEPVPYGAPGELLVRSSSVSPGYWGGPGRLEGAPEDGWCRTGDLVRQGDGGDLWFAGRKKDLIIRGGSNVSPVEVEQVLRAHPAVRDAAVTGLPDPVLGQRVAALVQLAYHASRNVLDDIRATARTHLADYKVPERLKVVDAIPRNQLGKLEHKPSPLCFRTPTNEQVYEPTERLAA